MFRLPVSQSQVFCFGMVMLAITGVSHKMRAQGLSPQGACTSVDRSTAWTSNLDDCQRQGGIFTGLGVSTVLPVCLTQKACEMPTLATGSNGVTITNGSVSRSCENGWTLVDTGGRYMCARELREPK